MQRSVRRRASRFAGLVSILLLGQAFLSAIGRAQTCIVTTPIGPADDLGTAMAIQPDGKIVLSGYSFSGASDDFAIVRYNPDFTLDTSFGTGGIVTTAISAGQDRGEAMVLQTDGKIVVAGHKNSGAGNNDFALVRYNPDGSLDTSFNPGGGFGGPPNLAGMVTTAITAADDEIEAVTLQSDGMIVVAGFAGFTVAGTKNVAVARYNTNGSLDTAGFNSPNGYFVSSGPTDDTANAVAIQPSDGKIVVAGWADSGVNDDFLLARLNTDGTQDLVFGNVLINFPSNGTDRAHSLLIQPDNKLLVSGEVRAGFGTFGAARRNPDGSPDLAFGAGGTVNTSITAAHDVPLGMALQTDQKIVLGGYANWTGGGTSVDFGLLRYDSTGSPDNTFDVDAKVTTDIASDNDWIDALALQTDGRIVAGGYSNNGADDDFTLARYLSNGSLDTTCITSNYRSIGVNGGVLYGFGNASITAGTNTVTFAGGASLPVSTAVPAVGIGDTLILNPGGGQEVLFILSRDSATRVTVQTGAMASHTNVAYEIRRAYTTLQAWEDDRDGDLVTGNQVEVGVAYKDGPFVPPYASANAALLVSGSITDANHYMQLTVANGQRHDGTAGTGVALDGQGVTKFGVLDQTNFTRLDWLELVRFKKASDSGFSGIVTEGSGAIYQRLIIHDFLEATAVGEGVRVSAVASGWSFTLRNSIIYDGDRSGIRVDEPTSSITVENCTVFDMDVWGVAVGGSGGTINVENTVSMNNGTGSFDAGGGTLNQSNTISSDGTGTLTLRNATDVPTAVPSSVVFANLTGGSEDLHLQTSTVNDAVDTGSNLSGSFCCDIDGGLRSGGWDIGADELGATTAVDLESLEAIGLDHAVSLVWVTSSELRNLGFHVYRSRAADGAYERITESAIPGLGSSPAGARYEYRDTGLTNGSTYYYKLEDIETTGSRKLHGPVTATPKVRDSEASADEDPVERSSRITYGEPAASSLHVVKRSSRELVLELRTEGFFAEPQEDGSVRITAPDFFELAEPGSPSVPVKRSWVETLAGRHVELTSVRERGREVFDGLRPSDGELPEIVASRDGTVRAGRRRRGAVVRRGRAPSEGAGLYPSQAARVLSLGYQGDVKKALVELAPIRWDQTTGRLELVRRLEVRLSFRGREVEESDGRRESARRSESSVVRLHTDEEGLYAVRFEEAFGRGRGFRTRSLRLSRKGKPVAFHVEPHADRFGPGSTLFFVSEGGAANPYGREAVYELEAGSANAVMESLQAAPSGEPTSFYWKTLRREENHFYQAALLEAPDLWLWDLLFAPETKSYAFSMNGLVPSGGAPRLRVWLQGVSDFVDSASDHHLRLSVNGGLVHETSWDGRTARELSVELPSGLLREGVNHLEIENVGDTEAPYSMVMLDRFEVRYPSEPMAQNGMLEGTWGASGEARVSGMGQAYVLDVTDSSPQWLSGAEVDAHGALRFRAQAGRGYLAVGADAVLRPRVTKARATGLRSERHGVDYLVIGPATFLQAARPLLELRRSEGLRVKAVSIEDVASDFGFGEQTPEAIRAFIAHAYHQEIVRGNHSRLGDAVMAAQAAYAATGALPELLVIYHLLGDPALTLR